MIDSFLPTVTPRSIPLRVLVIDDDLMSRELLGVLLEGEGYAVDSADSGDSALTLLSQHTAPPDVVLADMHMPGTTGAKLARKLRHSCGADTLLLAISGSQPTEKSVSQFDGFLLKPFGMKEIAAVLSAHTRRVNAAPKSGQKKVGRAASTPSQPSFSVHASAPDAASNKGMETQIQELQTYQATGDWSAIPVLNEKIYQQLAGCMPAQQLHEMYMLCVNDARERITVMRSLLIAHDATRFVREAHTIKGSCGMLGATQLHGMAAELEQRGLETPGAHVAQQVNFLDELSAACDRLERMLGSRV